MKKAEWKRLFAMFLALVMCLSLLPTAFAGSEIEPDPCAEGHTYGEDGLCTVCGAKKPDPCAEGHTYGEDGVCTVCGAKKPDPCAEGHTYGEDGVCTVCGAEKPAEPALCAEGHSYGEDGVCTVCGAEKPAEAGSELGSAEPEPLRGSAAGVDVEVLDPYKILPEGVRLVVGEAENEEAAKMAIKTALGTSFDLAGFATVDIAFYLGEEKLTLTDAVDVTLKSETFKTFGAGAKLFHIDGETATEVEATIDTEAGSVSFSGKDFSPYALGEETPSYTITVHYIYEDGTEAAEDYTELRVQSDEDTSFTRESPVIENYKADKETVEISIPAGQASDLEETVTYIERDITGAKLTATITNGSDVIALDEEGTGTTTMSYRGGLTLNVTAEFGAGEEKIVEITLPQGMSFRTDEGAANIYVVNNTDATLKSKTTPPLQSDPSKQNIKVLGVDQYNGTLTLQFHGTGEANDAKRVSFNIPLRTAWSTTYNNGLWNSGTAWFYDSVDNAVTVTQTVNGRLANEIKFGTITITNDETKRTDKSWTATYNPEVDVDGTTTGEEWFRVQNIPNGSTYPNQTAYKLYSVTYLAPESTEFVGFSTVSGRGKYGGAAAVQTAAGGTTANGYTVPEGMTAFTWTVENRILTAEEQQVYPIWHFPEAQFPDGSQATISIVDWKMRYYGREYEDGAYETVPASLPSLTYNISSEYEEVFANVRYQDNKHTTDGYISDYTLYMGAPGFEHIQEREAGYFLLGNRGLADSAPKTVTIEYDTKNTGAIGVTQQEIPALNSSRFTVSQVQYKTWDSATGTVSDWTDYTGSSNVINLQDLGVKGDAGVYIKALRFNISTFPKLCYLKNGLQAGNNTDVSYYYYARVLTEEKIERKNWGDIETRLTIANTEGDRPLPEIPTGEDGKPVREMTKREQDTGTRSVVGRNYDGTHGQSLIVSNCDTGYSGTYNTEIQVGQGGKSVLLGLFHHAWATLNAQYIDAIYLISPFGEEFTDIRMDYGRRSPHQACYKTYQSSTSAPQPVVSEITPTAEVLAKYPNARLYKLDFTGITDPQQMYDARLVGGSSMTAKTNSNTPLSTNSRTGMSVLFSYSPELADPTGTYTDLAWVEWHTDAAVPVSFVTSGYGSHHYTDSFNLTGKNSDNTYRVGHLDYGITLLPTEGLEVSSAAKQKNEVDDWYRTYDGTEASILGIYSDANFRVSIVNQSSLPVNGLSVYWPVPKAGENWGVTMCPEGAFKYSLSLSNALREIPTGYEVYYAKNVNPSGQYAKWDENNWVAQADTAGWGVSDWNAVNFVKMVWVGTEETPTINYGEDSHAVFDLRVDTTTTMPEQMYTLDVWQPYFLREYTNSSSWVAGEPTAARLTPGRISGVVWAEYVKDGMRDAAIEPPVPGVRVELWDLTTGTAILRAVTTTDDEGGYLFDGLRDGTAESGGVDSCRVVVTNPGDPEAEDPAKKMAFTIKTDETDMKFDPAADQKTAELTTDTRTENKEKNQKLDCGLVSTVEINVPVTKVWKDNEGRDGVRPESLTFRLMLGETEIASGTATEDSDWSYEFTGVLKYVNGEDIEKNYTVTEDAVYGYRTSIEANAEGGFTVTNALFAPAKHDPPVEKVLLGNEPPTDETFQFVMKADDPAFPMPKGAENGELTVEAGVGKVEFGELTFTFPGTYTYTISEVNDGKTGYVYDDTEYGITYVVTPDLEKEELVAERTFYKDGEKVEDATFTFTNVYHETTAEILVSKAIDGRDWEDGDSFTFTLEAQDEAPMPTAGEAATQGETAGDKAAANPEVTVTDTTAASFGAITYYEIGTYTYTVTETKGELDGVAYDVAPHVVTVEVTEDEETREISASLSYDTPAEDKGSLLVTNIFAPVPVTLELTKVFTGRDWTEDDVFTFVLTAMDNAPMPEDGGTVTATKQNPSGSFGTIRFLKTGSYEYTIVESAPREPKGITYDTAEHHVVVTVSKNAETNALIASVTYDENENLTITNTYASKGEIVLGAEKSFVGGKLQEGQFSFELRGPDGKVIETVKNDAEGKIAFSAIPVDNSLFAPGESTAVLTYTVREDVPLFKAAGVTYDARTYTATVTLTDKGDGTIAASVAWNVDGKAAAKAEFVNTFTVSPKTSDSHDFWRLSVLAVFALLGTGMVAFVPRKKGKHSR